ncbi:2,3,4,5-tetrahydropyridine-2,6-dicarboxylate N-succinyltransferase [Ignavibacteria bacterium]
MSCYQLIFVKNMQSLQERIETLYDITAEDLRLRKELPQLFSDFTAALERGVVRAAEQDKDGLWQVNQWVKRGIILLFRAGVLTDISMGGFPFFDKSTLPLRSFSIADGVRIVPGGSAVRAGSHVANGVICMPPMYINIGAYIDEGSMIDSHALVGTCAQIGKRVHISAAAQIGGVLEPAGARPVIVEDDVMIGGNCGVYEGVTIRRRAVLGSGVILNSSTAVFDVIKERVLRSSADSPLEIPEGAVIIPGSRPLDTVFGRAHGLSTITPIIIKYRDEKTDAKTALESALR